MADQDQQTKGEPDKETPEVEMKTDGETVSKQPEKPSELEIDAVEDKKPKISGTAFTDADCTLNVVNSSNMLGMLMEGGMQYLLAGARANTGIKSGRYMFETRIIELHSRSEANVPQGQNKSRPVVRVGFSQAGSSHLMTDDSESSICFDMDGFFYAGKSKKKVAKEFKRDAVVAVLLNLDSDSPNKNTISLFREGARLCEPQPIPEKLLQKPLFPTITYRNASIQVNFGPAPLVPLPFKCNMIGAAAKSNAEVAATPKAKQQEIVFPIGLPDQGFFDFVDAFLEKHPDFIELSDRMILDWACKSGLARPGAPGTMDKPNMRFGVPQMDDNSVRRVLRQVASMSKRSFIVSELQGNLMAAQRQTALKQFALPTFKKIARVVLGEPSQEHKSKVQDLLKQDKLRKAESERRRKVVEQERARLLEERKKKVEESRKPKAKEGGEAEVQEEVKDESKVENIEEPLVVELTDEEKGLWYRKHARPEISEGALSKHYANFSLPSQDEGFDQIEYEWQKEAAAATLIKAWISAKKMTQRVEDLKPGDAFTKTSQAWSKTLSEWRTLQSQWKDQSKRKALLAKRKEAKAKEAEEKGEAPAEDMEINFEDLDVETVTNVMDIGTGEPLFSNFMYEDWQLLSLRRELNLLIHSFKKDLDDPERTGFAEKDLSFYYNKYFKRNFVLKNFNCESLAALVELIPDAITISAENSFLEALHPDDVEESALVKIVESQRRDRQRRLDAGDESAELKFPRAAQAPATRPAAPWQAGPVGKASGKGKVGKGPLPPGHRPAHVGHMGGGMIGQKRPTPPATAPSAWAPKKPRMAW